MLKTPSFWYPDKETRTAFLGHVLSPLSAAYSYGQRVYQATKPAPAQKSVPVVCVGNITAGGSGKTPTGCPTRPQFR